MAYGQSAKSQEAVRPVDFVKKVGRGKTLSQDLTAEEARLAFDLLLAGRFSPAQFGAFLQALRIKELTQAELDALAVTFRDRLPAIPGLAPATGGPDAGKGSGHSLVLNMASDTARKGGLASLIAAAHLGRLGVAVGVVRSAPVLSGNLASFEDTWALAKGVDPGLRVVGCADAVPGLSSLDALRGELGFRSCLHTAEKLVNPWPGSPLLLGISHKHYALRMASTMAALGMRGKVLLGNHGTVDLVLHKETEMVSVDDGGIREEAVSPADLGLTLASDVYSLGRFPEWEEWLKDPNGPLSQVILYHLAVFLWAAGAAPDPSAGLSVARSALGSR